MSKATIIYCHGFASVGKNLKSDALAAEFGADNVIAPDLPVAPSLVEEMLDRIIATAIQKSGEKVLLVGTSLGGFWSNYMSSKWNVPCVMVNPSVTPVETIAEHVGKDIRNYATGETITVTDEDIAEFAARQDVPPNPDLKTLFLAKDDEVLDHLVAFNRIRVNNLFVYEDGGHRFEKHWPEVISVVKYLLS